MKIVRKIDFSRPKFRKIDRKKWHAGYEMYWEPEVLFFPECTHRNFTLEEMRETVKEMEKMNAVRPE